MEISWNFVILGKWEPCVRLQVCILPVTKDHLDTLIENFGKSTQSSIVQQ